MTSSHGNFIWYDLLTTDAARAKLFYDNVAGWTIEGGTAGPIDYRMIAASDGPVGGVLPLTAEMLAGGAKPVWLGYICVDDVDANITAIEQEGGKVVMPAVDMPDVGRFAMVNDPQGVPYYIMTPAPSEDGGVSHAFSPTLIGHCAWNELATTDRDAAIAFYTQHYAWHVSGTMPMGESGDYAFLNRGDVPIGAAMARGPDSQMPPLWLFYFRVVDIDAAHARVISGGGSVHHGPQDVPGGDRVIVCSDPMGAMFGLIGK